MVSWHYYQFAFLQIKGLFGNCYFCFSIEEINQGIKILTKGSVTVKHFLAFTKKLDNVLLCVMLINNLTHLLRKNKNIFNKKC